ncbi:hypothetical protein [Streptomyces sp. MNU89]|uniref:hypothetical protein n=1 Tax=Streptomyces sp. MNU89 TaxID=2560025 RepID=UPI001E42F7C5|nr:hypothetical protein [Streptomyces sp. MNU89]MCC9740518.1 hypothetical protein [Streptomyces sp. MNU89]
MIAAVGAVFGAVLLGLSFVTGLTGLTAGFVGVRMTGQGALSLVATTTVAYWLDKRRGSAHTLTIAANAFGPLAISLGHDLTGGYGTALVVLTVIPAAERGRRGGRRGRPPPGARTADQAVAGRGSACGAGRARRPLRCSP